MNAIVVGVSTVQAAVANHLQKETSLSSEDTFLSPLFLHFLSRVRDNKEAA